jgi:two-component system, LytTR family, response regulator
VIKAVIIDDELSAVTTMQLMLQRYAPEINVAAAFTNPLEAVEKLPVLLPDLVFLDIQMPVLNGFEMLKQLPQINFSIIFTTAHDHYAIEAIRFSALDYLLKPIDAEELKAAAERFKLQQSKASNTSLYQNLLNNIRAENRQDFKLALPTSEGTFFFSPDDIIRLEGENNYTRFYFNNSKPMLLSKTLKEYDEILTGHGFIRTHKSHLVNKKYVVNCSTDGIIQMGDNSRVEISRRRKEEVMAALKKL